MNLKQYAEGKYLSPSTVTKYIKAHQAQFEGLIVKRGHSLELSDTAVELLNLHFGKRAESALPDAVASELSDLRMQLLRAQERIIQLQDEQQEHATLIAAAKAQQLLADTAQAELAERNQQLLAAQADVSDLKVKTATMQALIDYQTEALDLAKKGQEAAEGKAAELSGELDRLRSRGLWQRILNR